jgi:hypothetical protein
LAKGQSELVRQLNGMRGATVQGSVTMVMNAVIARVPVDQYPGVQSLPGVKRVYFSRPQRMLLDTSAVIEKAQGLWSKAGGRAEAGRGIKIGIIDSGINITNPMFIDDPLTPLMHFPKGETHFANNKVIVARNCIHLLARGKCCFFKYLNFP